MEMKLTDNFTDTQLHQQLSLSTSAETVSTISQVAMVIANHKIYLFFTNLDYRSAVVKFGDYALSGVGTTGVTVINTGQTRSC